MTIHTLLIYWIVIGIILFPIQLFISAPYGRHSKSSWGLMIDNKIGWLIMEGWALLTFCFIYAINFNSNIYALFFGGLYALHYINRSLIFPFRTHTTGKKIPLVISLSAMLFNSVNASLIAYYLSLENYPANYFSQWNFIAGLTLFIVGFYINNKADAILINLRKPNETGYKIPKDFLFDYISCPNLFGEMIEWLGFALLLWNLAGVSFFNMDCIKPVATCIASSQMVQKKNLLITQQKEKLYFRFYYNCIIALGIAAKILFM